MEKQHSTHAPHAQRRYTEKQYLSPVQVGGEKSKHLIHAHLAWCWTKPNSHVSDVHLNAEPNAYLPHVLLRGEHQLVVQHPVRLLLEQCRGRVDEHRLLLHYRLVPFLRVLTRSVVEEAAADGLLHKVGGFPAAHLLQVVPGAWSGVGGFSLARHQALPEADTCFLGWAGGIGEEVVGLLDRVMDGWTSAKKLIDWIRSTGEVERLSQNGSFTAAPLLVPC